MAQFTVGDKVVPVSTYHFFNDSGYYGSASPEFFVIKEIFKNNSGSLSARVFDTNKEKGSFMSEQYFNLAHFKPYSK